MERERPSRLTWFLCGVLVITALPFFLQFLHAMATTSLTQDEILSVRLFASKGAMHSLTSYDLPNNHILFNVLNSFLVGEESLSPIPARILSFLFVLSSLVLGTAWFFRQGRAIGGALFFHGIAMNYGLLGIALQARGYGLLLFVALLSCIAACRYDTGGRAWKAVLLLSILFGTWTVPVFLGFGAALLLILFLLHPRKKTVFLFLIGSVCGLLPYAPHLGRVLHFATHFGDSFRRAYGSASAVTETMSRYLLNDSVLGVDLPVIVIVLWVLFLLAALVAGIRRSRTRWSGAFALFGATVLFFLACVLLGTVPLRSTSFAAVPILFLSVLLIDEVLQRTRPARLGNAAAVVLVLWAAVHNIGQARGLDLLPKHNLQEVDRIVTAYLPEQTSIYVTKAAKPAAFTNYFRGRIPVRLLAGPRLPDSAVVVDFDPLGGEQRCFTPEEESEPLACFTIPQRSRTARLYVKAPARSPIRTVRAPGDTETATGVVRIVFAGGERLRSLFVLNDRPDAFRGASAFPGETGGEEPTPLGPPDLYDRFVVYPLGDLALDSLDLTISDEALRQGITIREMWAYPAQWK